MKGEGRVRPWWEGCGGGTRLQAGLDWAYQIFTVYIEMLRILTNNKLSHCCVV